MGDTALYSADTLRLLHQQQQLFVTRVPFTLLEARQAVGTVGDVPLQVLDNGYQGRWMGSGYASVPPTLAVAPPRTDQPPGAADAHPEPAQGKYP